MELEMKDYSDDFEGWCRDCVLIPDKESGARVPFLLNRPQRRVAGILEEERISGRPIRIIMVKARQWGGSTLVEAYMAWLQLVRHRSRSSLVCAHTKDAAAVIRGMYSSIITGYPDEMRGDDGSKAWTLQPFERTQNILYLPARDCRIAISTTNRPDALRGSAFHMAHLSEAAFWADGDAEAASAIIRTVCSTVPLVSESLIVIESTANGKDNYLYREWKRAERGESDKRPVFVAWHEIEMYSQELTESEEERIAATLDTYEQGLISQGATLGNIAWYRRKLREYQSREEMMAEFPSTAEEAFVSSTERVFEADERPLYAGDDWESDARVDLIVLVPDASGKHHLLSRFKSEDGKIHHLGDEYHPNLAILMKEAERYSLRKGSGVVIANVENSRGVSHGRWCERMSRIRNLRLIYDEEGRSLLEITAGTAGDLADIHAHKLREGEIVEHSNEMDEHYERFSLTHLGNHELIIARLTASHYLGAEALCKPLDPKEFIE